MDLIVPFIGHHDASVRASALSCTGKIFNVQGVPSVDMEKILFLGSVAEAKDAAPQTNLVNTVMQCIATCVDSDTAQAPPIPVEALEALCCLAQSHVLVNTSLWQPVVDIAVATLSNKEGNTKLYGTKLLGLLGKQISESESPYDPTRKATHTNLVQPSTVQFWNVLMSQHLTALFQDPAAAIRSSACDCASYVGNDCFAKLSPQTRVICQTQLLGLTADQNTNVRAAASRALGVFVLYPELRDDLLFVMDVANCLIQVVDDKSVPTRVKASWALGNLGDSLVARHVEATPTASVVVPTKLLVQLAHAALKVAKDNDKVRPNAMRSLGGLGRIANQEFLQLPEGPKLMESIALELLGNVSSGAVKIRWNACHALGHILGNNALSSKLPWMATIIKTLCDVVSTAPNFKVRINAAQALQTPTQRPFFGPTEYIAHLIKTLILGVDSVNAIDDFSEFKYQPQLREQVRAASRFACTFGRQHRLIVRLQPPSSATCPLECAGVCVLLPFVCHLTVLLLLHATYVLAARPVPHVLAVSYAVPRGQSCGRGLARPRQPLAWYCTHV